MHPSWQRVPGQGRYAQPERERRFLLAAPPPPPEDVVHLEDRYLRGTRLRLRTVSAAGAPVVHKLTQKVRPCADDPSQTSVTTAYLSPEEHAVLAALPAALLRKTRSWHRVGGRVLAVDTFLGPLAGLRLVEAEVDDVAAELALAAWVGAEVTADDRYCGGQLASLSVQAAHALAHAP